MAWGFGIVCYICSEDFQNVNNQVWHYMNVHGIEPQKPKQGLAQRDVIDRRPNKTSKNATQNPTIIGDTK